MNLQGKPVLLATVFTDYICPFCYIGDLRLDRLRDEFELKINWCFLEIHPDTPATGMPITGLGYSDPLWQQMMENLDTLAGEEGVQFCPHEFTTNSHQALLLAEAGKEDGAEVFYRLHRRLFEAYFTEGRNIGDTGVLTAIAREAGVADATRERAWSDIRYEKRLAEYLAAARDLGVQATPTVFFGEHQRLGGALPFPEFQKAARAGAVAQHAEEK
jgi:predicted DsbA family dithiol-disulfide isomerase